MSRTMWGWAALLLGTAGVAVATSFAPQALAIPALALVVALLAWRRPRIGTGLVALVWLGVAPLPTVLPSGIQSGQGTLLWADLLSPVVAVWAAVLIARRRGAAPAVLGFAAFAVVGVIAAVIGVLQHGDTSRIFGDFRPFVHLPAAGLGTAALLMTEGRASALRVLGRFGTAMILWTAFAVAVASAGGSSLFDVSGHSASLYAGGDTFTASAARFSPPSALFCELAAIVLLLSWVLRLDVGVPRPLVLVAVALGVVLTFISYSRGFLLAGAVTGALLLLMLAPPLWQAKGRVVAVTAMGVLAGAAGLLVVNFLSPHVLGALQTSMNTYAGRVLTGLNPSVIQVDSSALWRVRESQAALQSVATHPVLGTGLGVRYRPLLPGEIFNNGYGRTYIHNAYLWLLVKTGAFGVTIVGCLVAALAVRTVRLATQRISAASVLLALGCGIAVLCITSPTPWEDWNSLLVGCLAGVVPGLSAWRREEDRSAAERAPTDLSAVAAG